MNRKHWLALVAAGALAALAGTAWATGAIGSIVTSDGRINGCYQQQNGQLRVVAAGEACRDSELALSWSQTGSKGDQGVQGPPGQPGQPGLNGDKGEAGAQGLQGDPGSKGDTGSQGEPGTPGAAGAQGDPGSAGEEGPQGAQGSEGPQGAPGQGVTSFDELAGLPCNVGNANQGVLTLSYASGSGAVSLACTRATAPPVQQRLTVSTNDRGTISGGGIACLPTCEVMLAAGSTVTLTATPSGTNVFTGWSGDCSGASVTCTLTIDGPKNVIGAFDAAAAPPTAGNGVVDFCGLQFPLTLMSNPGASAGPVYGRIFESGVTDAPGADAAVIAQLGYGPVGTDPRANSGWAFTTATYNLQFGNDDEYQGMIVTPSPGSYSYTYRFSLDGGATYTYCDSDGAGENPGLSFDPSSLGLLTVT